LLTNPNFTTHNHHTNTHKKKNKTSSLNTKHACKHTHTHSLKLHFQLALYKSLNTSNLIILWINLKQIQYFFWQKQTPKNHITLCKQHDTHLSWVPYISPHFPDSRHQPWRYLKKKINK
jgi:hypothetical protein